MPSRWIRKGPNKLKKCSERRTDSCGAETDGCCGVIACTYCLEFDGYDGVQTGTADFTDIGWEGTIAGATFFGYWERQPSTEVFAAEATNSIGMSFARITGGDYTMGSPGSETGRDADETEIPTTVSSFYIQGSEVTQSHYQTVMGTNPSGFSGTNRPVETVSFANAQAFCDALNALPAEIAAGRTYRLPTEAEWEYACRAGTTTAYSFGADPADLTTYGWYATNSGAETHDVGGKPPNDFGLTDMHGNVWEWCVNSRMDGDAAIRGGGWNSSDADCRSASRSVVATTTTQNDIGFRVIMEVDPEIIIGECEFVVTLDNEEVYRKSCYEGQSCRDSSDSTEVTIDYEEGTLTWTKKLWRPLPLIDDPDTGCRTWWCGDCHCTCEALCVTVTDAYGTITTGELPDTAYSDCEGPVWEGTIAGYDLSVALERDEYGECIVGLTADGEEGEWQAVTLCKEIAATWTLYDGTTVAVSCKECDCVAAECDVCDCEFTEPLACLIGTLQSTTIPGDTCAGGRVNGTVSTLPALVAWVDGEDTAKPYVWDGFNLTIPCGLDPLDLKAVLVRRAQNPSGPSPYVDNDIVLPCEYYYVIYNEDESAYTISYGYELCCGRAEAIPTCQTRLGWIRFTNVPAGRGTYDFLHWSHSGSGFYPDGFQGVGIIAGECPFSDGDNPCL